MSPLAAVLLSDLCRLAQQMASNIQNLGQAQETPVEIPPFLRLLSHLGRWPVRKRQDLPTKDPSFSSGLRVMKMESTGLQELMRIICQQPESKD